MERIDLYSSWRGIALAGLSPGILIALGAYGLALGGWLWLPGLLLIAGVTLLGIMVFDFPLRAQFGDNGVTRRMLGRSQVLAWDDVMVIERLRKRRMSLPRWLRIDRFNEPRPPTPGGLVALTAKRRRYLLLDRGESQSEYDGLVAALGSWAPDVVINADRPHDGVTPTHLYRRRG